jgi:hypothetical protein
MPLPMVPNEIKLELLMGASVLNVLVCLKKCLDYIRDSSWIHTTTRVPTFKEELKVKVRLIRDHIAKNHTSDHDVTEGWFVPEPTKTSKYCKSSLQNTEISLDVFPGCILCL